MAIRSHRECAYRQQLLREGRSVVHKSQEELRHDDKRKDGLRTHCPRAFVLIKSKIQSDRKSLYP